MRQVVIADVAVTQQDKNIAITINRAFIEEYKNRVLIHAAFTIDRAMAGPLPAALDGDLHMAGRSPQVALPCVSEIVNAASEKEAVDLVHRMEGRGRALRVAGAWRIWPEHAGAVSEQQGTPQGPYNSVNPSHVFEIHPLTRIDGIRLLDSFHPVEGYKPGAATRTFGIYQKATCALKVEPKTVSIITMPGLYNDVEFTMEITGDQQVVDDGRFVIASVTNPDRAGYLAENLRMVFVKGTAPERAVRLLKRGDRLHVEGIPRLNFEEISRRVREAGTKPAVITGPLPYEIIVMGVYPNKS